MKTRKLKGFKIKSLQSLQGSLTLLSTLHVNTTSTKSDLYQSTLPNPFLCLYLAAHQPQSTTGSLLGAVTAKKLSQTKRTREKT